MRLFIVILIAIAFSACGKDEVKRPSEDSALAGEAASLIESIRSAYEKKDMEALEGYLPLPDYKGIKDFDSADLEFTPRLLEIDGGRLIFNVSWTGAWRRGPATTEERGMAVFELQGPPLKVIRILRGSPFGLPR